MRIKFKDYMLLLLLAVPFSTHAQLSQTLRGQIAEAGIEQPVPGAVVRIVLPDTTLHAVTDAQGWFAIKEVPLGRHKVMVQHVAYRPLVLKGMLVEAGKEPVLQLQLEPAAHALEEAVVHATKAINPLTEGLNTVPLSVEQTERTAVTFYDPARFVETAPGVIIANDQANNVSVRGNTPNAVHWELEGLEIVNPNHLSNAGTFSDRITYGGGSVNILSSQLLGYSAFYKGAFAPEFGNAVGGIFDMHLRRGNNEEREHTVRLSLLGMDFATEGPVGNSKASYLVNYRYSTIGLLSALGVDFGNEAITFQDLSFNLVIPTQSGTFTVFGIGGLSQNDHSALADPEEWESEKDRYDILFSSKMGAAGATYSKPLGSRTLLNAAVAWSGTESSRLSTFSTDSIIPPLYGEDEDYFQEQKLSGRLDLHYRLSKRYSLRVGSRASLGRQELLAQRGQKVLYHSEAIAEAWEPFLLLQPYVALRGQLSNSLSFVTGLHLLHYSLAGDLSVEPRFQLAWAPSQKNQFTLAYGLHSQTQLAPVYFARVTDLSGEAIFPNLDLGLTKAHHITGGYTRALTPATFLKLEAYYQHLYNIPVAEDDASTFSAANQLEGYVTQPLVNEGIGRNYGLEMSLLRPLESGYYYTVSATLFESEYATRPGGEWLNTPFNSTYAVSAVAGGEIYSSRGGKSRSYHINVRSQYRGGFWQMPIVQSASVAAGATVFNDEEGYTNRLPNYFRTDIRFAIKRERKNYTRTISLDLQNVTNHENVGFYYFDPLLNEVIAQNQLGIVPVLAYRIDF